MIWVKTHLQRFYFYFFSSSSFDVWQPINGKCLWEAVLFWIRMFHLSCWQSMPSSLSIEIWLLSILYCLPAGALMEWRFEMTVICYLPVIKCINLVFSGLFFTQRLFFKKTMHILLWKYSNNLNQTYKFYLKIKYTPAVLIFQFWLNFTISDIYFPPFPLSPNILWFIISIANKICSMTSRTT